MNPTAFDFEKVPLGKQEYVHDPRTLMMEEFVFADIRFPAIWDFDRGRSAFPVNAWGNFDWGDCVCGGQTNHLLRLERVEQRWTVPIREQDVVDHYKIESKRQFGEAPETPGDKNDKGLYVLGNLQTWRNIGWTLPGVKNLRNPRTYKISAYGELDPANHDQLRRSIFLMQGIEMGFWLPKAAAEMTNKGVWDYNGQTGPEWQPGSWGGHLVYAKAYDPNWIEVISWGLKIQVTNAFIDKFCDEAWAVVDDLDSWKAQQTIDVAAMTEKLKQISSKINQ